MVQITPSLDCGAVEEGFMELRVTVRDMVLRRAWVDLVDANKGYLLECVVATVKFGGASVMVWGYFFQVWALTTSFGQWQNEL